MSSIAEGRDAFEPIPPLSEPAPKATDQNLMRPFCLRTIATWRFVLLCSFIMLAGLLPAQLVRTKDGIALGERQEFIAPCVEAAGESMIDIAHFRIDALHYCSCLCDQLIPNITFAELQHALTEQDVASLVLDDRFYELFMACAMATAEFDDELNMSTLDLTGPGAMLYMKECERTARAEIPDHPLASTLAGRYCQCSLEQLQIQNISYGELLLVEQEDSRAFNELVMPCLNQLRSELNLLAETPSSVILGTTLNCVVPLVDLLGKGFNVKLTIGGMVRYFLLDTGASDLIIGDELERELLRKGVITSASYPGLAKTYELADGSRKEARMVLLNEVVIGEYRVRNVLAAVVDGGSLLCGRSFLDQFRHWEIRGARNELLLER
jgi:clan AA aspartic protease (TIGR02281 family)